MKKIRYLIALFCIFLVISIPVAAQTNLFSSVEPVPELQPGGFASSQDQYLGEAIIVNVAGTNPPLIRQSALEQQDLPFYAYIKGTTTGTLLAPFTNDPKAKDPLTGLISVPPIDSVQIEYDTTSNYSKYVRFVRYIRPPQQKASLNNLGMVIVFLRQLPSEKDMPPDNTIILDLKARIFLKLQESNLFGMSKQDLIVKAFPNQEEFLKHKDDYSFFSGKGFIKATRIGQDSVTLQVYNRDLYPLSLYSPSVSSLSSGVVPGASITLTKGKTSQPISFRYTGNPLNDLFQIKLEDVSVPSDKAELEFQLNGRTISRKISVGKDLYSGSSWFVKSVSITDSGKKVDSNNIDSIAREFNLNPQAKDQLVRKLNQIDKPLPVNKHVIILENKYSGETKKLEREIISDETGNKISIELSPITKDSAELLEAGYCGGDNTDVPSNDFACIAVNKYKQLLNNYSSSYEAEAAKADLGDIFYEQLIEFTPCLDAEKILDKNSQQYNEAVSKCREYKLDMLELAFYYYSQVGLKNKVLNQYGGIGGENFIEDEGVSLKLIRGISKDQELPVILLRIYDQSGRYDEKKFLQGNIIDDIEVNYQGKANYRWGVESVYPESVNLRLYEVVDDKGAKKYNAVTKTATLKINEPKQIPVEFSESRNAPVAEQKLRTVEVKEIVSNYEAYITVIPGAGRGYTTSDFRIHIPIDPRPFKWTPEQLESQIKATRDLINDFNSVIEKLDKYISTMKKICLGVFALLTIKNSFTGTRNIARKLVSENYKVRCEAESRENPDKFPTLNRCLNEYSDEIKSDVDKTEAYMDEINDKIKGKNIDEIIGTGLVSPGCGSFDAFATAGKATGVSNQDIVVNYRDCLLYDKIQTDNSISQEYKNFVGSKINNEVDTQKKIELFDRAKEIAKNSGKNPEDLNQVSKIISQLENIEQSREQQRIENLVELEDLNPEEGFWSGKALLPKIINPQSSADYEYFDMHGLNQFDFIAYKNNIKDTDEVEEFLCENSLDNAAWENKKCIATEGRGGNKELELNTKISDMKSKQAQDERGYTVYVKKGFFDETKGLCENCDPVFYYSSDLLDNAGRIINPSYSENTLYAYYDNDGLPYCYPVGKGNYAIVERFPGPGRRIQDVRLMNVGPNGRIECGSGDDETVLGEALLNIPSRQSEKDSIIRKEPQVKCSRPGETIVAPSIDNKKVKCKSVSDIAGLSSLAQPSCTSVMDPVDCKWLFNFCDPVMCPSSRCTLGGLVPERNVIQSGVIGSTLLCLPNIKEGIVVPICATGISAGLKNIVSILEGYAGCLEANLKEGKNVGFCDYIRSVGICEMVWKEAYNLLDIGGRGFIDWASGNIFDEPKGGGEYLRFQSSLENVGESVRVFTNEYKTTYTAQFLSQSTEEIGTELCRLSVNGKLPSVGKILDQLTEPENPPQFTAFFDETPYSSSGEPLQTGAGVSQEQSLYKVFYHLYAGTGFYQGSYSQPQSLFSPNAQVGPPQPITYSVYLVNNELYPGRPLYVTFPGETGFTQTNGRVEQGKFVQQTVQKLGPKGYTKLCVNINNIEQCGFGKVSSSFGLKELGEVLTKGEAEKEIDSAEECVPDSSRSKSYSIAKLGALAASQGFAGAGGLGLLQPQEGALTTGIVTSNIENNLLTNGVVRVCSVEPPSTEPGRWLPVGTCGNDERGKSLGDCWLDGNSVNIENRKRNEEFIDTLLSRALPGIELIDADKARNSLDLLNKARDTILESVREKIKSAKEGKVPSITPAVEIEIIERPEDIIQGGYTAVTDEGRELELQLTPYINQLAEQNKIDPLFLRSIIKTETDWRPYVVSCAGAAGIIQLMPHTAKEKGIKILDPVLDPETSAYEEFCFNDDCTDHASKRDDSDCKKLPDNTIKYNAYAEALKNYMNNLVATDRSEQLAAEDERFDNEKAIKAAIETIVSMKNYMERNNIPFDYEHLAAMYNGGYLNVYNDNGMVKYRTNNQYEYVRRFNLVYDKLKEPVA